MDFFHRPKNKMTTIKITTFRKLVLLPSSAERRGKRGTPTVLGPLGIQQSRTETTSFRNVVILIVVILFFGRWKKSKNPLLHSIKVVGCCNGGVVF
jgi:hypothetical protein